MQDLPVLTLQLGDIRVGKSNQKHWSWLLAGRVYGSFPALLVDFLRTFGYSGAGRKISPIMDCWKGSWELQLDVGFDQAESYPKESDLLLCIIISN